MARRVNGSTIMLNWLDPVRVLCTALSDTFVLAPCMLEHLIQRCTNFAAAGTVRFFISDAPDAPEDFHFVLGPHMVCSTKRKRKKSDRRER
jgi:hypothetical protein